ncbi:hypothetical protein N7488_006168 [Penicillium malachiteum]|nr:hypothetical protein N7488_006168 [Penicillium malachiteum]
MDDEYPPSAIFLEYIPGLEKIHPVENFTQQRMDNLFDGIRQINKALVLHNDLYPRNMMVIKDTPESKSDRVIWLDFDRAETFNEDEITDEQARLIAMEEKIVSDLGSSLAIDHEKGELDDAYMFYC